MLRKTLVTLLQSLHDMILSLYLKIHSFTQKLTLFAKNDIFYRREITPLETDTFQKLGILL